jgi:glycosyltransferase involved in cell wall biosynthesis
MKITVAIVTRNRRKQLKHCLDSLIKQLIQPYEVIIVDNASTDATEELVSTYKKKLPIQYFQEKKVGIAYARNTAIEKTKGDILAFIDDDVTVPQNWLFELLYAHKKYKSVLGIQGYSLSMPEKSIYAHIMEYYQNTWLRQHTDLTDREYNYAVRNAGKKGYPIRTINTRNCSFKIKFLRKAGFRFDTSFLRGENTDLGKQIHLQKQKIIFYPAILVYHWEQNTFTSFLSKALERGKRRYLLDSKWGATQMARSTVSGDWFSLKRIYFSIPKHRRFFFVKYLMIAYSYKGVYFSGYMFEKYKYLLSQKIFLSKGI